MLVGRQSEVDLMAEMFARAEAGEAAAVLFDGPMGIGKTSLLSETARRADRAGMTVLTACADRMEQEFGFGVVRQLLERTVVRDPSLVEGPAALAGPLFAPDALITAGSPDRTDTSAAVLHGLYWLIVRLAEAAPVLFVIDDVQWIDKPSLRWLTYLFQRMEGLPVLILAARRVGYYAAEEQLFLPSSAQRITLTGLDEHASAQLIRSTMGQPVADEFVSSCHNATNGNPLLLTALLGSCRLHGVSPDIQGAERILEFGSDELNLLVRSLVEQLGPDGVTVVEAVAVLGDGVSLELVAAAAEIEHDAVGDIVYRIRRAGLMVDDANRSLSFVHAAVRAAIAGGMLPSVTNAMRQRAARKLFDDGADRERIAAYLIRLPPVGQHWVPEVLIEAAMVAMERGAPESAAAYLRRALHEPLTRSQRASALMGLGTAELGTDLDSSITHLTDGIHLSTMDNERERFALLLGRALCVKGRYPEAIRVLQDTRELLGPAASELTQLEVDEIFASVLMPDSAAAAWQRCADVDFTGHEDRPVEAAAAAFHSFRHATHSGSAAETIRYGRRALELRLISDSDAVVFGGAAVALNVADDLEAGWHLCDRAVKAAVATGAIFTYAVWCTHRGEFHYRCGRLLEAQADLQAPIDTRIDHLGVDPRSAHVAVATGALLEVLVARAHLGEAEGVLHRGDMEGRLPDHLLFARVLVGRGRLRLAQRDPARALADFRQAMDLTESYGITNPTVFPCRHDAVVAELMLDRPAQARELAERNAELCQQWGTAHARGTALRTQALVEPQEQALKLLHESVQLLSGSPSRLDYGHALADLGGALLRDGSANDARERLREALDLAEQCGATALSERVLAELKAAGGRPRTRRMSGIDALTPSERRVAALAAAGASNQRVAQQLFVGLRTVEIHLTNTYRKLGVNGRAELSSVLSIGAI